MLALILFKRLISINQFKTIMMKHLLPSLILVVLSTVYGFSQTKVQFSYDARGNRIGRAIVIAPQRIDNSTNSNDTAAVKEQLGEMEMLIYPNPVLSNLTIKIKPINQTLIIDGTLTVINAAGFEIGKSNFKNQESNFDFSSLPTGLYVVLVSANGEKKEIKVIKE